MAKPISAIKRAATDICSERRCLLLLLLLVLVTEIAVGVVLGLRSIASPQAGDTIVYGTESSRISSGDWSWLAGAHNYLYPAFLAVLHSLGLWTRLRVGIVQIALLYLASFVLVAVLTRCFHVRFISASVVICGIAILPAAAWSGYWLSEGLAAPVLLLVIALWVLTCHRVLLSPGAMSTAAIVFGLGLVSGFAWMARPALIWVPVAVGLLTGLMIVTSMLSLAQNHDPSVRLPSSLRALTLVVAFLFGVALAVVPQLARDASLAHLLKLNLASMQAHGSSVIWRYSTNLSGCGPEELGFSPLSNSVALLVSKRITAPDSILWTLTTSVAHLVSGWDPRPSPSYATVLSSRPWIFVTLASGFVCTAPLFAASWLVAQIRLAWAGWRARDGVAIDMSRVAFAASIAGILVFFAATEFELTRTATEFRFNLMGWLSGGACIVCLMAAGWLTRTKLALYVGISLAISVVVVIIGEMTLDYSSYWLQCSR
jgi:hypothetical protein